jgi:hypothetical protein
VAYYAAAFYLCPCQLPLFEFCKHRACYLFPQSALLARLAAKSRAKGKKKSHKLVIGRLHLFCHIYTR